MLQSTEETVIKIFEHETLSSNIKRKDLIGTLHQELLIFTNTSSCGLFEQKK